MTDSIQSGKYQNYYWFRSDEWLIDELFAICPEIVEGQYVVRTYSDSAFLVPFGRPQGVDWEKWSSLGMLGIVASEAELDVSEFDEYYIYNHAPEQSSYSEMPDDQLGLHLYTLDLSDPDAKVFWDRLSALAPESYLNTGLLFTFVTENQKSFEKFVAQEASDRCQRHASKAEAARQALLSTFELAQMQECTKPDCKQSRVKFGVFCPDHHLEMLGATRNPFDYD